MLKSRWLRGLIAALVVTTSVIAAAGSVDATETAPSAGVSYLALSGQPSQGIALHAGFVDPIAFEVRNNGLKATTSGDASVAVTLPAGVTLTKLSTYSTAGQAIGPRWSCGSPVGGATTCQLPGSSRSPLVGLTPGQGVVLIALVRNERVVGSRGQMHLTVALPGAAPTTIKVDVAVISNGVNAISVVRQAIPVVGLGGTSAIQLALLNSATSPASFTSAAPATISNILSSGIVTSWSSNSPGWTCTGAHDASPSCSFTGGAIAARSTSAPLTISYTARATSPLLRGGKTSAPLTWRSTLLLPGPYGEQEHSSFTENLQLVSKLSYAIGVEVHAVGGASAKSGSTKVIDVINAAKYGAPKGVTDTVIIPKNTWVSAVSMNGWSCPAGTGTIICVHPGPVVSQSPFGFSLLLHVSPTATMTFGLVAVESAMNESHVRNANFVFLSIGVNQGNGSAPMSTTPRPVVPVQHPKKTPPKKTPPPVTKPVTKPGTGTGSTGGTNSGGTTYTPPVPFNTNYMGRDVGYGYSTAHFTQGPGQSTGLYDPTSLTVDSSNNAYFIDNCTIIKMYAQNRYVGWFGGLNNGYRGGFCGAPKPGDATRTTMEPAALAIDAQGNIYEADSTGYVAKITPYGVLSIIAGTGSGASVVPTPGPALSSGLPDPTGIAVDSAGNIFVSGNWSGSYSYIAKISASGTLSIVSSNATQTKTALSGTSTGQASSLGLTLVEGLATDASGNLYASADGAVVVKITPSGVYSVVAGNGTRGVPRQSPGPATTTSLDFPIGVSLDAQGNLFIAEPHNIMEVTTGGTMVAVAGNGSNGNETSGPATSSPLSEAFGVAAAPNGSVYFTDAATAQLFQLYLPSGPPTAVGAVPSNASATVSFGAPTVQFGFGVTSYTVTAVDLTNAAHGGQIATGTTSPITITGLTNGDQYVFAVSAINLPGASTASVSDPVIPSTIPDPPRTPSATGGIGSATVSWSVPAFNGGIAITSYTASDGQGHSCTTTDPTALSCTIVGLTPGQTYFFTVVATNINGNSVASDETYAYLPPTVPDTPTGLTISVSATSATATWNTPAFDGGIFIAGYTVSDGVGDTCSTTDLSCVITGLTPGQTYTFRVVATNSVGDSAASATAQGTIAPIAPDDPNNVSVNSGTGDATVSWDVPDFNGGSPITQYVVSDGQGDTCSTAGLSCTVSGLTPGQTYTFRVVAINVVGSSPGNDGQPVTITSVAPDSPTGVAIVVGSGSATVSFVAPAFNGGDPITSYTVSDGQGDTCTTAGLSCTIDGLTPGQTYTFTVTATNVDGTSLPSSGVDATIPALLPLAPTHVTAASGPGSATIAWSAPSYDGGSSITSYTVSDGQGDTCTTATLTCVITGLVNGQSYTFTVTATNAVGTSPTSTPSAPVVPATAPDAPTNVVAAPSAGAVTVTWSAPANNGGAAITSYTVSDGQGDTCVTSSLSCTIRGLTAGQSYTFTVTATNVAGISVASAEASATPVAAPSAPTKLISVITGTSVTFTWVAPTSTGDAPITSYTVSDGAGHVCTTTVLMCTISGLVPGQHYSFTVTASNFAATSEPSVASSVAIAPIAPTAPQGVSGVGKVQGIIGSATISWSAPTFDGGSPITSYTVTGPGGLTCTTTSLSCTISGLIVGQAYSFTVTATNAVGTSQPSNATQVTPLLFPLVDGTVLGGFTISNIVEAAGSTAATFKGTVTGTFNGLTLSATLSFTNLSNWTLSASGNGFTLGSGTLALTGSVTDVAGTVSGSFTAAISNPVLLDEGASLTGGSLTIADTGGHITLGGTAVTLTIGSVSIPVAYTFVDLHNWSVAATNLAGSFAGGTLSFSGTLSDTAGTVSGSFTASIASPFSLGGGVSLSAGAITISDTAGAISVSGTKITLAVGTALTLPVSFTFVDSKNWSIAATNVATSFEGAALSFSGTIADAAGTISGSLTATITNPVSLGGGITLPSGSLTITDTAGTLSLNGDKLILAVGSALSLPITFSATGLSNWTISDVNVPVSFDGVMLAFSGTITDASGTISGSLTASIASPISLGAGVSLAAGSITISDGAGTFTVGGTNLTLNFGTSISVPISFTFTDAHNWTISATNASASFDGGTLTFNGSLTDAAGAISGSLSAAITSPISLGAGVSLSAGSISVTDAAGVITIGGASITLAVGTALSLPITLGYVDLSNWTISATNQTISFDGGTLSFSGSLTNRSGTISGSLTAAITSPISLGAGVSLTGGALTVTNAGGVLSVGGTNITLAVGSAFTLPISFTYSDAHNWTVQATNATATLGGGTLSFSGILVDTAGTLSGALSATVARPLTLAGSANLTAGTITISVGHGVFIVTGTNVTLTIGSSFTLPISFTYTDSHDWSISVTNATVNFGSGSLTFNGALNDVGATVSGTLSATISTPLNLGAGISFTSGTLAISDEAGSFSINGTKITLSIGSAITLPISFTSVDPHNWTITANNIPASFDGVKLSFSGALTDSAGAISGSITATLTRAINLGSGVSLTGGSIGISFSGGAVTVNGTAITLEVGKSLSLPITFTYNDSHNWTISVTNVAVSVEGANLSFSGSLADTAGTIDGSLTASLVSPINLGAGVSLTAGSLTISDTAGTVALTGTNLTLSLGSSIVLPISFVYSDAKNWSITATASNASGSIPLAAGLSLPINALQGTVAEHAGALSWSLSASLGSGSISLIPGLVTLTNARVSIGNSCAPVAGIRLCSTGGKGTIYFAVSGLVTLSIGSVASTSPIPFGAAYNVSTGGFDMVALLPSISFSGIGISLTLKNPVLALSYNDSSFAKVGTAITVGSGDGQTGGFNFSASGTVSLQVGNSAPATLDATLTYSKTGFALIATFSPSTLSTGLSGISLNGFVLTEAATTVAANGTTFAVPAGSIVLVGNYTLPTWLTQALGLSSTQVALFASFASATNFQFSVVIPDQFSLPSIDGYTFTFSGGLHITVSFLSPNLSITITQNGTFTIPAQSGQGQQVIPISFSGSYANGTITVAISAGIPGSNQVIWANAMGVAGLNLYSISMSLGVTAGQPIPDFGFQASGSLPPAVLQFLGISSNSGVPVTFAINISATNPCIDVTIGRPGGGNTISILNGVITASYAQFVAAPNGCTIGNFSLPSGFSIAFDGTFFNIGVKVTATINENPFTLNANVNIQGFKIGPFDINNPQLAIALGPTGNSVAFSGGIQLGSAYSVQISGSFSSGGSYSFSGTGSINVLGFNLQAKITVASGSVAVTTSLDIPNVLHIDFKGSYTGTNDLEMSGSAYFDPGGFKLGQFQFSVNTATQTFTGSAYVSLGSFLSGSATVSIRNVNGSFQFDLTFAASFNLANIVSASGTVDISNSGGPVQASINGTLTWTGLNVSFSGTFNSSWGFSISVYSSVNLNTGVIDTGLVEFQGSLSGSYKITISSNAPYVFISASMQASLQAAGIQTKTTCGTTNGVWGCHTDSWWGDWATLASVGVSVDTDGNVSINIDGVSFHIKL